uniref:Cytochrome c oxidase subunit 8B n=1 Tax=Monopterus albus TaxID=43700 RepID=A0A3Q3J4N6_MONAL
MPLPAASRLFRSVMRTHLIPVAHVVSKPPKHNVTAVEQAIAMTVLFATILVPSGWVLAQLEDYKTK